MRYWNEARITLQGDRALAQKYVSEGRKFLGALTATHPQLTAVRELTNADGIHFRVGYFNGTPFITITAPGGPEPKYSLVANRGYVVAPRTFTYNYFNDNPAVIINPFKGVETLWPSSFYEVPPGELSLGTHPTSVFTDPFSAYRTYFPELSSIAEANLNSFALTKIMSWNNSDESLWLYWEGCEYGRTSHVAAAKIFMNGKMVIDLNTIVVLQSMICGVSAKRGPAGIRVYFTLLEKSSNPLHFIRLYTVLLRPTDAEKTRLDKLKVEGSYGYASEYEADLATLSLLRSHQVDGVISYISAFTHNQSATECRGFLGISSGTSVALSEYVINYEILDEITVIVGASVSITRTESTVITYGNTLDMFVAVEHCQVLSDPESISNPPTRPPGVYNYTLETAPAKLIRYTAQGSGVFPQSYYYRYENKLSVTQIKCFVDYIDDRPVYGYLVPYVEYEEVNQTLNWEGSASPPTGTLVAEVFDGTPDYGTQDFVTYISFGESSNCTYTKQSQGGGFGIKCPLYRADGQEDGYWINETNPDTYYQTKTQSHTSSTTAVNQDGNAASALPVNGHLMAAGCTLTAGPWVEETTSAANDLTFFHLNLRTKSAFTVKSSSNSHELYNKYHTNFTFTPYTEPGINLGGFYTIDISDEFTLTTSGTARTAVYHAGGIVFDSGTVVTIAESVSTGIRVPVTNYGYYGIWINGPSFVDYENQLAVNEYLNTPNNRYNSVESIGPYGDVSFRPDPDVDESESFLPVIAPPFSFTYLTAPGQPDGSIGMATTKNTYIVNANYNTTGGDLIPLVIENNTIGSLDYMTGAHSAPYFSAPFLTSAIAMTSIQITEDS